MEDQKKTDDTKPEDKRAYPSPQAAYAPDTRPRNPDGTLKFQNVWDDGYDDRRVAALCDRYKGRVSQRPAQTWSVREEFKRPTKTW